MGSRHDTSRVEWSTFPFAFLGYGFLYAWGYVSWETPVLQTRSFSGTALDITWLSSAMTVPIVLICLALLGRRSELDKVKPLFLVTPLLAVLGSLLSVVYRYIAVDSLALATAIASGLFTGIASALFIVLWSLMLSHLNMATLEVLVPSAFIVSIVCSLFVTALSPIPALIVVILIAVSCGILLAGARAQLELGRIDSRYLEGDTANIDMGEEAGATELVRMLLYGCIAWALSCLAARFASYDLFDIPGVDVSSFLGYVLAVCFALLIIRYALRVDFYAFAYMTLAPFVLCMVLAAFGTPVTAFLSGVIDTAMGVCFEIILLLYFIRIAQWKRTKRTFYLALGSSSGYLGVFLGTVLSYQLFTGTAVFDETRMGFYLILICVYVFSMLLIPQRRPYHVAAPSEAQHDALTSPVNACVTDLPGDGSEPDTITIACDKVAEEFQLSTRESQMCVYLAHGRSQTYIRDALFLSKNTVATHTRHLYTKLGVHSKQELIDLVEAHEERI